MEQQEQLNEIFNESTLLDMYRHMNEPSFILANHEIYMHVARIGGWDNYIGLD